MGRLDRLEHIGSQSLVGLLMLITASATAKGTTQITHSMKAGYGALAPTAYWQESAVPQNKEVIARAPQCTSGFSCKTPNNQSVRISRREVFRFALLLGAGATH